MVEANTHAVNSPDLTLDQAVTQLSKQQQQLGEQKELIDQLQHQLDWFKRELFGSKNERREPISPDQLALVFPNLKQPPAPEQKKQIITYERGKGKKQRPEDCVSDAGLRFGPDVPMETVMLAVPEYDPVTGEALVQIDTEIFYRLAQRQASYVVIRYEQPVMKIKVSGELIRAERPCGVFERSIADVSFLAGILCEKFQYHIPLYRQHQRLAGADIVLSRATLTNLSRRSIELLRPIVDAQLQHILLSRVLAMDETPIKAGKSKSRKGRMHTGYYWPVYGEQDEIVFVYADGRAHRHVQEIIGHQFTGTIVSDGYAAYARYAAARDGVTHAQCWSHSRRKFIDAEGSEPEKVSVIVAAIGALYANESSIREKALTGKAKLEYRTEHSKPVVDQLFALIDEQLQDGNLLPSSPYAKALNYVRQRQVSLQVFLSDPEVPLDTNHVERKIRSIAMGKRAWLFNWTELGAELVGVIQSLISTCVLHDVNPYTYLVDVLQRVQTHPNSQIDQLTPRLWKHHFAENPLRSDLEAVV